MKLLRPLAFLLAAFVAAQVPASAQQSGVRQWIAGGPNPTRYEISITPNVEALTFKGLLLRLQANIEKDPGKQQSLIKEATELSDKANELRKKATGA